MLMGPTTPVISIMTSHLLSVLNGSGCLMLKESVHTVRLLLFIVILLFFYHGR